jgi:hypothetical protein
LASGFDRCRDPTDDKPLEIDFAAGVVDVATNQLSRFIAIEDHPLGDLAALNARLLRQVDVERIRLGMIVDFHGLNRLSKNTLWIVTLSARVTTRRYLFPSSGTKAQNRYRLPLLRLRAYGRLHDTHAQLAPCQSTLFASQTGLRAARPICRLW